METPTFFANSLRFAGKSDALAELCGRCALHTAEETGEIRPSILSFCVLKFHAALAGCAKLEGGLAVGVGDEEVGLTYNVHTDKHGIFIEVGTIDYHVVHDGRVRQAAC